MPNALGEHEEASGFPVEVTFSLPLRMNSRLPSRTWSDFLQQCEPSLEGLAHVGSPPQMDLLCAGIQNADAVKGPCIKMLRRHCHLFHLDSKVLPCLPSRKHQLMTEGKSTRSYSREPMLSEKLGQETECAEAGLRVRHSEFLPQPQLHRTEP